MRLPRRPRRSCTDDHAHAGGRALAHDRDHGHDHGRAREGDLLARLRHLLQPHHSHEAANSVDAAMEASAEGMRTLWISFAVLGVTTLIQAAVVALSGSVALLGDTMH